jgi:hypothetical protein
MYLDSCIIVKLLAPEPDSADFEKALRGQPLTTSELAFPEVCSALLARERAGGLGARDRDRAWRQFQRWIEHEEIVLAPLDSAVLRKAARLLDRCHPAVALRTLDALHLATADIVMEGPLCSTDRRLRQAASRLGLEVYPPA